ncbi:PADI3 deiminase, partial [Chunga burmeisteri]|nr:PADI3 deiminase [Chunga burmeisteri]
MAQQRRVQLSTQRPTSTVCVLGTELSLDVCGSAPKDAVAFHVQGTPGVKLYVVHETQSVKLPSSVGRWPLATSTEVLLAMDALSKDVGDEKVRISYFGEAGGVPVGRAMLYLTCVEVSLDTDANRSGAVSRTLLDKATWTWGPDGHGAILLVNCDRDDPKANMPDNRDTAVRSYAGTGTSHTRNPHFLFPPPKFSFLTPLSPPDLKDMSQMVLRTRGPRTIFTGHRLLLHVDFGDADKVGVFYGGNSGALEEYRHVLGGSKLAYTVKPSRHQEESVFYVEGLAFPDVGFAGLVAFHVTLLESPEKGLLETPIFTDTVVFRVAPWIMTPNTAAPLEVFVCSVDDNEDFVAAVGAVAEKAKCPLTVCPLPENRQDRWIQDEVEFGYVQAPHKTFPVVFDSPRDRGLKDFPVKSILGPDFGYVARQAPEGASSLDSFGNLEVSPPVTVRGKEYPLGRILIGSSFPRFGGRRMAKAVKDFLVAQQVQAPVELFSDWLLVGHVDEFLSFVPAPDRKVTSPRGRKKWGATFIPPPNHPFLPPQGFRLLLASPSACYQLLKEKQEEGFGEAVMFEGLEKVPKPTINEILANEGLRKFNNYVQSCISWNRDILKRALGLTEPDILDIPQLFRGDVATGAKAFFPDMVNMLVLGRHLGIPKPFGPRVGGQCCLEQRARALLEPLGLTCTFIDDYFSYHLLAGEVHCGTNVRRKPFAFKWWHMVP